jgi:hypothetical protein
MMDIGLLNEKSLHADLKTWYARPDDEIEVKIDGYFIDIVRRTHRLRQRQGNYGVQEDQSPQDLLLVEIQTGNFSAIKQKLNDLTTRHSLRLVYPIAQEKWIVKRPRVKGDAGTRRKSPKRGQVVDIFRELVYFPELLNSPNFSLEVLLIQEEEVRRYDGRKGWRRGGWVREERHLLSVIERRIFQDEEDLWRLIPNKLPAEFTTADLSSVMEIPKRTAGQVAYCLRKMNGIEQIGKRGRSYLYARKSEK